MSSRFSFAILISFVLTALALLGISVANAAGERFESRLHAFEVVTLAEGMDHPWGLAFLPDGSALITEREGGLYHYRDGQLKPVGGAPEVVVDNQGGLLDIALHPGFADNGWVYMTYAGRGEAGVSTHLARARFDGAALSGLEVLLQTKAVTRSGRHFGSRLQFDGAGHLYMTIGDRGDSDSAQVLGSHAGSVLRLTEDGSAPDDNPFVGQGGALPEIWSYGHRNPQGMARRPSDGSIWAVEHGPRGGDELNRVERGINYGWPVITYGKAYSGLSIGDGISEKQGMAQPARYWVPSISPSGLAFYDGEAFPEWRGNLFLGALSGRTLVRLTLDGDRVTGEERLLDDFDERIRDVRQGPDGLIYLLTDDSDGRLLRLEPAG